MDILDALNDDIDEPKQEQEQEQEQELNQYTFKQQLRQLGCDNETIEDCLFEPIEKWEFLLNYFEEKQ